MEETLRRLGETLDVNGGYLFAHHRQTNTIHYTFERIAPDNATGVALFLSPNPAYKAWGNIRVDLPIGLPEVELDER